MASPTSSARPAWLRNPVFKFFASVKLAVVLLAVLIIGAISGTIYESSFDAKVARAYVYGAPWFNIWLILLGTNLAVSALSRWPWRKHHVAFLVTHLGIITLLTGSLIGRIWGTEGTITLFKGEPPTNRLLVDQHQLRVHDIDGIVKGFPAEFLHHPPTPERPRDLGLLASGARLSIIDYAPAIEGKLNPKPLNAGGAPALHFTIKTAMMGQNLESWLLADDPQHGTFGMGLANIELKRGAAALVAAASPAAKADDDPARKQLGKMSILRNRSSRLAKRRTNRSGASPKAAAPARKCAWNNQTETKDASSFRSAEKNRRSTSRKISGSEVKIDNTPFTLKIDNYWPDFRIQDGKPGSLSDQPNNPAVLVTIRGKGAPVTAATAKRSAHGTGKRNADDRRSADDAGGGRGSAESSHAFSSPMTARSLTNWFRARPANRPARST